MIRYYGYTLIIGEYFVRVIAPDGTWVKVQFSTEDEAFEYIDELI